MSDEQPDPILDRITRLACRTTGASVSLISFVDGECFRISSATGSPELLHPQTAIPRSQSLCERVVQQQQALAITDTERSDLAEHCKLVKRTEIRSFLGVPLTLAGNVTIGTLSVADTSPREWSQDEIAGLTDLAALLVDEIERRQHAVTLAPAEALAHQKRRQKERLLDAIGEGVYAVDTSGVCQFINRAGANILGYEPEQIVGQRMHELVHDRYPDGRPMPREECTIVQALQSGKALHVPEQMLWRRDGSPVYVEITASPVTDLGEITGTVVRFSELSEYTRQQEKLRESEVRKSAMFEAALDCIITIDHEGRIVEFNAAAERTFGYSREFAIGRLMADLILPPEYRDSCLYAFANHLETGKSTVLGGRIERPAMRSDGSIIQTEMAVTRIDLPDREQPLFTAYLRDITERQQAEEALRIHKHMVDAVGQVVIANDNSPERRITYWNRAAEQILGWTADEAIGQGFYDIVPASEFHDDVRSIGQRVRAGENWQGEFQLQHRDGTSIPAIASVAPILNDEGELLGVISAYTDVSEIKETEREIRLYKHIVDAIGESVVASDMDRRIFYANRAAEEALGWSIDDVKGLDVRDVVPDANYRDRSTSIGKEVRSRAGLCLGLPCR